MGAAVAFTRRTGKVRPVAASPSQLRGAHPELMQMLTTPPAPLQATAPESANESAGRQSAQGETSVATSDATVNAAHGPSLGCALVFGREESGLTAQELSLCTHLCAIPTGRTKPSMNLSHAVSTVLATFFEHCSVARDGEDEVEGASANRFKSETVCIVSKDWLKCTQMLPVLSKLCSVGPQAPYPCVEEGVMCGRSLVAMQ